MAIALQGGHFDKPDRLFTSIEQSWLSASSMNLQVTSCVYFIGILVHPLCLFERDSSTFHCIYFIWIVVLLCVYLKGVVVTYSRHSKYSLFSQLSQVLSLSCFSLFFTLPVFSPLSLYLFLPFFLFLSYPRMRSIPPSPPSLSHSLSLPLSLLLSH